MARSRIEIRNPDDLAKLLRQSKPAGGKPPRGRSKYKAKRVVYKGISYDSMAEAAYSKWLDAEQAAGRVLWHEKAPTFHLGCPENTYRPDKIVVIREDINIRDVWLTTDTVYLDDVKGTETKKFKHDKKLWAKYGPTTLRVVKLTLNYAKPDEDGLPSVRKVDYEIVEGGNG
jgi:hypothetical protein